MLFMNNRPLDAEFNSPKRHSHHRSSRGGGFAKPVYGLQKVTLVLNTLYLFVSAALALFHYPVSMLSLVLPLLLLLVLAVVMRLGGETALLFCSIAATIGALGKAIAIIVYATIFGFSPVTPQMLSDARGRPNAVVESSYTQFFVVLLISELSLLTFVACARCNLGAIRKLVSG